MKRLALALGCTLAIGVGAAWIVLAAHGSPRQVTVAAPLAVDPYMVDVMITDKSLRPPQNLHVVKGQQIMFMVMNHNTKAHRIDIALPLSGLAVDDPDQSQPVIEDALSQTRTGIVLTAKAGGELDIDLTAIQTGSYAATIDGVPLGNVVVS